MLEIIRYNEDEYGFPCLLVLGCFDAIHLGHRELLKKAKLQAKINGLDLGVMTFIDGKSGKQVFTLDERKELLEQFNVKFVLTIDFNDEFKKTTPKQFLEILEDKLNVKAYMSGKDFRFGAGAKGKSGTLKTYAEDEDNGVWYMSVKDVTFNDEKISTSLIKTCLENGEISKANSLLGCNYSVKATVESGAGRGKEMGFPTINLTYPEKKANLKYGVYKISTKIGDNVYYGIANYGNRPTFDDEKVCVEAYIENFNGDLYGQEVKVEFIDYIRDTQKFASAEELKAQLEQDLKSIESGIEENAPVAENPVELKVETTYAPVEAVEPVEAVPEAVEVVEEAEEISSTAVETAEEISEDLIETNEEVIENVNESVENENVEAVEEVIAEVALTEPEENTEEEQGEQATEEVTEKTEETFEVTEEVAEVTEPVEEASVPDEEQLEMEQVVEELPIEETVAEQEEDFKEQTNDDGGEQLEISETAEISEQDLTVDEGENIEVDDVSDEDLETELEEIFEDKE